MEVIVVKAPYVTNHDVSQCYFESPFELVWLVGCGVVSVVWCGVWCGVVGVCGVVWLGCVVWCGVVWLGCVVWCGVVWCGVV